MAVFGLLISLVLIIILMRRRWPLGGVMILGAVVVGAFSPRINFYDATVILRQALVHRTTVNLLLIILFICILGELMYRTGGMDQMVKSLNRLFTDVRVLVALLPALIGLLPIMGGAVFSAPMVDSAGKMLRMNPWRLALANVFYRHIFIVLFPLYPGLIIAMELSELSLSFFIRFNLGIMVATFIFSFWYIFRGQRVEVENKNSDKGSSWEKVRGILQSLMPLVVVLLTALVLGLSLPLALVLGIVVAFFNYLPEREQRMTEIHRRLRLIIPGIKWPMLFAIVGIMIYRDFVLQSSAVDYLAEKFVALGIPLVIVAVLLPYISGMVTGNQVAALGISVPIVLPMVSGGGLTEIFMGLIYIGSVIGYVVSPAHLCLILTIEHFDVPFGPVFRHLNILMLFLFAMSVITAVVWWLI